jgi:putative ABC transport system permease protein
LRELQDAIVGSASRPIWVLQAAVGFVLLIVCVNVANLILTRALGRTREMAIRTALGAGRFRLVRGVLVESIVLAIAGGVGGLVFAYWLTGGIAALQQSLQINLLQETRVDGVVMVFTAGISLLAALLFGTLPAWHTSSVTQVAQRIREDSGNATGDRRRQRIRGLLIVAETALAVVLLVGAGLLMRSFLRLMAVDLGFDARGVQTFNISLPPGKYAQPAQRAEFVESLVGAAARQPGVEAAGAIFGLPLTNFRYVISMSTLDGRRLDNDESTQKSLRIRIVTPDYFRALGIRIVQGRSLSASDRLGAPLAVVINETAAARLWPDTSPLGHEFTLGTRMGQGGVNAGGAVVGVARDVHDFGPAAAVQPAVYLSHAQFPVNFVSVVVRGANSAPPIEPLRAMVAGLDPDLPIYRVLTMEQAIAEAAWNPRIAAWIISIISFIALCLSVVGLYAVTAHSVAQRTQEIGVRVALGAEPRQVRQMVLRRAMTQLAWGLAAGTVCTLAWDRLFAGGDGNDVTDMVIVATVLVSVAGAACLVPAWRATRVDPVVALRME